MSKRTADWQLVGHGDDPVPASQQDVEAVADVFSEQGQAMARAESTLTRISRLDGWCGEAATEFADQARDTRSALGKAATKYTDAGVALDRYADEVGRARTRTWTALTKADNADGIVRANQVSYTDDVADPSPDLLALERQRLARLRDATADLSSARAEVASAVSDLETAARTAAGKIRSASESFKDGFWDNVKGVSRKVVNILVDVLNVIAIVIAVAIVVLLVVTGAAPALLLLASLVVGAAILMLTLAQAAMGDADEWDIAFAVIGAIPGGGTFGKLAASATRSATRAAGRFAWSEAKRYYRLPLHNTGPNSWLDAGAIGRLHAGQIHRSVNAADHTAVSRFLLGFGGKEVADLTAKLRVLHGLDLSGDAARLLTRADVLRDLTLAWELAGLGGNVYDAYKLLVEAPGHLDDFSEISAQDLQDYSQYLATTTLLQFTLPGTPILPAAFPAPAFAQ